jgi:filamentous hemagglutinin
MIGYKDSMYKTVYDPKIIPDDEMLNLGQIAANTKFEEALSAGKRIYDASAGGVNFRVYINNGVISNVHPKF